MKKYIAFASICIALTGCTTSHKAVTTSPEMVHKTPTISYNAPIVFVSATARPGGDGRSWATAFRNLQEGLDAASQGKAEVWISEGTYIPQGKGREATFKIPDGVHVYGSLKVGTTIRESADVQRTTTFLSGNIGDPAVRIDNSFHVVTAGNNVFLDSLKITNGQANGTGYNAIGGGLILAPKVTENGRTVAPANGSLSMSRIVFSKNYAMQGGGWATTGLVQAKVSTTYFTDNAAISGGALLNDGTNLNFNNVHFFANRATKQGGAIWFKGGDSVLHSPLFTNNTAGQMGGAILITTGNNPAKLTSVTIDDALFSGDRGGKYGGGVANTGAGMFMITESHMHDNFAENGRDIASLDVSSSTAAKCVFIDGRGDFYGKVRSIMNRDKK